MPQTIALERIRTDGGTQSRVQLNEKRINLYADDLREGAKFPPIIVFFDGTWYWLADGFHRVEGYRLLKRRSIAADVRQGTQRDAILYSVGANATHGLRRTNADKRNAVMILINDEEWGGRSNNWIAETCGVSYEFVRQLRPEAITTVVNAPYTRTTSDGRQYPVNRGQNSNNGASSGVPGYPTDDDETPLQQDDSSNGYPSEDEVQNKGAQGPEEEPESATADTRQPLPPQPTLEEQITALPLAQALTLYAHGGNLFRQQARLWHECTRARQAAHADLVKVSFTSGPFTEAVQALGRFPDPSQWEGCPACKGSGRVGERNDPCGHCKGGFVVHKGEGVSADAVRRHAQELTI